MVLTGSKSGIVIACSLCLFLLSSCAGSSVYMKPSVSQVVSTQDKALVRFMRPSGMGFGINFNMLDGTKVIGNSVAKSQFDYLTDPGRHLFIATAEKRSFWRPTLLRERCITS